MIRIPHSLELLKYGARIANKSSCEHLQHFPLFVPFKNMFIARRTLINSFQRTKMTPHINQKTIHGIFLPNAALCARIWTVFCLKRWWTRDTDTLFLPFDVNALFVADPE
jgi:hypothetical protein